MKERTQEGGKGNGGWRADEEWREEVELVERGKRKIEWKQSWREEKMEGGCVCVRVCRNERSYGLNEGWWYINEINGVKSRGGVCVWRESSRERDDVRHRMQVRLTVCLYVCVGPYICVCVRERDRWGRTEIEQLLHVWARESLKRTESMREVYPELCLSCLLTRGERGLPGLHSTQQIGSYQLPQPNSVCVWQYASAIYKKCVSAILVFVCMRLLLLKTCIRIVNSYVCK